MNIAENPPVCLLVCARVTWYIGWWSVQTLSLCFFSDVCFFFFYRFALTPCGAPHETSENIDTDLGDAMDRQSLWGTGCIRSSSECIKSDSSMKLVDFGKFLNFLFTQYNSPNRRKREV